MILVALAVLIVVAVAVAGGVHTGPHGLVAAGVLGILASIGVIVAVIELSPAHSRPAVSTTMAPDRSATRKLLS